MSMSWYKLAAKYNNRIITLANGMWYLIPPTLKWRRVRRNGFAARQNDDEYE